MIFRGVGRLRWCVGLVERSAVPPWLIRHPAKGQIHPGHSLVERGRMRLRRIRQDRQRDVEARYQNSA